MPNYRCPICGANHKKAVPNCRLCGQNMSGDFIPSGPQPQASSTTVMVGNRGGTKGVFLVGLGIVVLLGLGALVFGIVSSNSAIESVKAIAVETPDGWTQQSEPDASQASSATSESGHFVVDLPGDRIHEEIPFTATKSGKVTVWTAKIGQDTKIQVGWGKVTPPPPGQGPNGTAVDQAATQRNYLKEIAASWAAQNNLAEETYTTAEGVVAGLPGYILKSKTAKFKINDKEAFGWLGLGIKGDTLYVVEVFSIYGDAPQFDRVAGSMQVTA